MGACDRAGHDLGELPGIAIRVAPLDGHEDVHALGARSLRKANQAERVERLLHQQRDLHGLRKADVRRWI